MSSSSCDPRGAFGYHIIEPLIQLRKDSIDARTATPTRLSFYVLETVARAILDDVPGIVSVTYNIAPKPPSTIEAV